MSLDGRLEALRSKHATIDQVLAKEEHRPYPDSTTITRLKREKLRLKDEISRLAD